MASVKHLVMFTFKPGLTDAQKRSVMSSLASLKSKIDGITDYCAGPNISTEGLSDGLTHGFVMTFADVAARDAYLPHPEHEKVKAAILPHVSKVVVFDFEA